MIDNFLIERRKKDFAISRFIADLKLGKKMHPKELKTDSLSEDLNAFFDHMVDIERIKVGKKQTIATLIRKRRFYLRNI